MMERKREARMIGWDAALMGAFALMDIVATIKRPSLWNAMFAALFTGFSIDSIVRNNKMKKANEQLNQKLQVNA